MLRTVVVRAESIGSAHPSQVAIGQGDSERTGGESRPRQTTFAIGAMPTLRSSSAFDLFDRLEQQLSQHLQSAECVPAAEVHETAETLVVVLELPGVDRSCIDVKATGRTLVVSTGRRSTLWRPQ
mgnify:CR=1 FL=1